MTARPDPPAPPRVVVNPRFAPEQVMPPAGAVVAEFHGSLPGYRPTPLHRLDALARSLGVGGVLVKDESDRLGLPAFKILGASWAVEQTLRTAPGTRTLVAASAGNHGRAVARAATQRSLACRIYLPAVTSQTRADLVAAEGAQVVRVAGEAVTVPTPGTSMAGLDCATPSAVAWPTLRQGLAGTIAVSDADAHRSMRELAELGLTIGDCGAASLAALRALTEDAACAALRAAIGLGAATNVLCLATEGASDPAAYAQALADPRM